MLNETATTTTPGKAVYTFRILTVVTGIVACALAANFMQYLSVFAESRSPNGFTKAALWGLLFALFAASFFRYWKESEDTTGLRKADEPDSFGNVVSKVFSSTTTIMLLTGILIFGGLLYYEFKEDLQSKDSLTKLTALIEIDLGNLPVDCELFANDPELVKSLFVDRNGYTFSTCTTQIERQRKAMCDSSVRTFLSTLLHSDVYTPPFTGFFSTCSEELKTGALQTQTNFRLPDSQSSFIRLGNNASDMVLIAPQAISTVTSTELKDLPLWKITLQTNNTNYSIYSGDEKAHYTAMEQLVMLGINK